MKANIQVKISFSFEWKRGACKQLWYYTHLAKDLDNVMPLLAYLFKYNTTFAASENTEVRPGLAPGTLGQSQKTGRVSV